MLANSKKKKSYWFQIIENGLNQQWRLRHERSESAMNGNRRESMTSGSRINNGGSWNNTLKCRRWKEKHRRCEQGEASPAIWRRRVGLSATMSGLSVMVHQQRITSNGDGSSATVNGSLATVQHFRYFFCVGFSFLT